MSLAPFAAIEQRIATATASRLANAVVLLANGQAFGAELNQADEPSFDVVTSGAESLVYRSCHALTDGEAITINGAAYRVAGATRRVDEHFSRADVVLMS